MNIDYLDEFEQLQEQSTFRGQQWFGERQRLVEEYSWAVPNEDAIRYAAGFEHIYDVGAGNGYWAKLIEDAGGSVTAIEPDPPEDTYVDIEQAKMHEYRDEISGSVAMMVWPPCNSNMAAAVTRHDPNHVLYVGEQRGGCTADEEFFDEISQRYGLVAQIELPSYAGVEDDFFHYTRKI